MGKVGVNLGPLPETRCCWPPKLISRGPRGRGLQVQRGQGPDHASLDQPEEGLALTTQPAGPSACSGRSSALQGPSSRVLCSMRFSTSAPLDQQSHMRALH